VSVRVGILALQGAVEPHEKKLIDLGIEPVQVRRGSDLAGLSGIILPGGESSTMIHLLHLNELWEPLGRFVKTMPTWGVCAGSILLAKHVTSPVQASFEAIDIEIQRNAYGRQIQSFISDLDCTAEWTASGRVEGVFIRAPRIVAIGTSVKVLFKWNQEPVMVEEGKCLASTFHPELTDSRQIHEYFLKKCCA